MTTNRSNPVTGRHRRAVGVFPNRQAAEHALHELRDSGFPMDRVSVIARDERRDDIAGAEVHDRGVGNKADEGATVGAISGGALGGITGLLVGLGVLAIPGIGPIMLAGATATTLATTLAGGAIGAVSGSLLGALIGLGIPEERARVYDERISRGGYLVIVDGNDADIARAEAILHRRGIEEYGVYDAPVGAATTDVHPASAPVAAAAAPAVVGTTTHGRDIVRNKHAIGIFPHRREAEQAINDLRRAGFPLSQVSLVARQLERQEPFAGVDLRDRFEAMRLGIPADRARLYHDRVDRGDYVVIVNGTEDEVRQAAAILNRYNIQEWHVYDPTEVSATPGVAATTTVPTATTAVGMGRRPAVGIFSNRQDAERAIDELRSAGFPLDRISLVAQRFDRREPFSGVALHDRFDHTRYGLPEDRARFFRDRVDRGDYVVIVHGTDDEIRQATPILSRYHVQEWRVYDPVQPSAATPVRTAAVTPGIDTSTHTTPPVSTTPVGTATSPIAPGIGRHLYAVGFFSDRRNAEQAIRELRQAGFPVGQMTLVAQRFEQREPFAGMTLQDRFDNSLYGLPEKRAHFFHDRLGRGDYVLILRGALAQLEQAQAILNRAHIHEFEIYDTPDSMRTTPVSDRVEPVRTPDRMTSAAVPPTTTTAATATPAVTDRSRLQRKRAMGLFSHRRDAEAALTELRDSGFSMAQVSLIGKDADRADRIAGVETRTPTAAKGNKADEGAKAGAATGGAVGGLGGLLIGLGALAIPGIGPVMVGGAAATALVTALSGGAIGAAAGSLTGGLVGLGIPENRAKVYNDRLAKGDYLLMIDGSEDEVRRAESVLRRHNIHEWEIFNASEVQPTRGTDTTVTRHTAPDVEPTRGDQLPPTDPSHPQVTIVDRRNEPPRP